MQECFKRPVHGGYPFDVPARDDPHRQFLDGLMDLCTVYGFLVTGDVRAFDWSGRTHRRFDLRDGTLIFSGDNLPDES